MSIASQIAVRVMSAAMKRHGAARARTGSVMGASNQDVGGAFHAASILEFHSRSNAEGPRSARYHQRPRAASAGRRPAEVDALVEQVADESLDVPPQPVEACVEVDQGRRLELALEHVRIDVVASADERNVGAQG